MISERLAGADARVAHLVPALASSAAVAAGRAHRHVEGEPHPASRVFGGKRDIADEQLAIAVLTEKRVAHAIDDLVDRRKVDGNLIREAVVRRGGPRCGFPADGCSHDQVSLTIGGTQMLVKATHGCYREQKSCPS